MANLIFPFEFWNSGATFRPNHPRTMNSSEPTQTGSSSSGGVHLNEQAACSFCGRYGAFEIGHQLLCPSCYEGCGSCCPEFGREDLTALTSESTSEE